jgi:Xaa-Pro aminopeptidase
VKSDLASLMQARNIDALLVLGDALHNPSMVYFTGVTHVTDGALIVKRGEEPILYFNPMERDEATKSGLETRSLSPFNYKQLFDESGQNALIAKAKLLHLVLEDAGVTAGRVAMYGNRDAGEALGLVDALRERMPEIEFVGEYSDSVILGARATKDAAEIEQMRDVGQHTVKVVSQTQDFLASQKEKDGILVDTSGQPITVAQVKQKIFLWLAEQGLDNPHGTIFAPGAEGGVPHSGGSPDAPIRIGEPIVFDIFPVQSGGGYYFDFTRTWCLGHVPDEVQALYDDVRSVYDTIMSELKVDAMCTIFQDRTCDLFAAMGHPTVAEDPNTEVGYVHGLAHGLGLDVHEAPRFSRNATDKDILRAGSVVTIEPGLYYPEKGMGVRLEDAVVVYSDGSIEVLVPYPLDILIPLKS